MYKNAEKKIDRFIQIIDEIQNKKINPHLSNKINNNSVKNGVKNGIKNGIKDGVSQESENSIDEDNINEGNKDIINHKYAPAQPIL